VREFQQVIRAIRNAKTFLITSHIRADGDSIGSALALAHALRKAGKSAVTCIDSQVPEIYRFLPDIRLIVPPSKMFLPIGRQGRQALMPALPACRSAKTLIRRPFDVGVSVDTPTRERLGAVQPLLDRCGTVISIDHHRTTKLFGDINWLDPRISSVGEMIFRVLKVLHLKIDDTVAQNLYTAIVTDTGRFTYSNTSPASLRIAADLMEAGLDFSEIARNVYQSTTREVFALRALAMETVHFAAGGRIGIMVVTRAMFKKAKASPINTQDFVDIPRSIKGVSVAVLLTEMEKPGWVKVSLRSDRTLESDKVAALFGGGGHARAAGCEIQDTIEAAHKRVLSAIKARLGKVFLPIGRQAGLP
jgi:phosphoesterase RecJ-like protein